MRLTRVIDVDINLFAFDFDLTMMTFFLSPEGKVYSRYGGRDSKDAENRLSLAGFRHTMESLLAMHKSQTPQVAKRAVEKPLYPKDMNIAKRGCVHCHNVKEQQEIDLTKAGKWSRDQVWRFPPPDNLGLNLEVDRGNVVRDVTPDSPAAKAGIVKGDQLRTLKGIPVHSFGDTIYALDSAPAKGHVEVVWARGEMTQSAKLELTEGWRKTDITWRPSQQDRIPSLKLAGDDLTADEKKVLGLKPEQLAFRQQKEVSSHASKAGFKPGDIIVGVDNLEPELTVTKFLSLVRRSYLVGDQVNVHIFRDGKRLKIPMKLVQ